MASPEYVEVPIKLTAEEVDVSKVDVDKLNKRLSSKLGNLKKTMDSIFKGTKGADMSKELTSSLRSLTAEYNKVTKAQEKFTAAQAKGGQAAYQKALKEYRKKEEAELRENPVYSSSPEALQNRIRQMYEQATPMPKPEDFAPTEEELQKIVAEAKNVASAIGQANTAGADFNKVVDKNKMSDEFNAGINEIQKYEQKLQELDDKTRKMEALGATEKQWRSVQYDAEEYGRKIDQVKAKLQEMVNAGTAFRFGPGRGERVKTRGALEGLGAGGAASIGSIVGRATEATTPAEPQKLSLWQSLIEKVKGFGSALASSHKESGKVHKSGKKLTNNLSKGFKKLGRNVLMFGLGFRSIYYLVKRLRAIVKKDFGIMAASFDEINEPLSELLTAFNRLKGSLGTALQPIISAIVPMLKTLVDYLSEAAEKVSAFFAVLTGQDYIYKAKANQKDFAAAVNGTSKTADYDQLKVIGDSQDIDYEKVAVDAQAISEAHGELLNTLKGFTSTLGKIWNGLKPVVAKFMPSMEKLVNNLLPAIGEVVDAVMPIISDTLPPVIDLLTDLAISILPVIVAAVRTVSPIIDRIVQSVLPILQRILIALQPIFDSLVSRVFPLISKLLNAILPLLDGILSCVGDLLEPIVGLIEPLIEIIVTILDPIIDLLQPILKVLGSLFTALGKILNPIIQLISPLLQLVNDILAPLFEYIEMFIGPIINALGDVLSWLIEWNSDLVSNGLNLLVNAVQWLIDKVGIISDAFKNAFQGVKDAVSGAWDFIKNIFNSIIGGIEKLANGVVSGINKMIDALNTISFSIPDWVPGLGGKTFGFNLGHIKDVSIPRLAQGAVLPPNREFLAMLGDQRHGTNVEAPLETIKQALIEALAEAGGSHQPIVLKLDGKTVAQVVWDQNEKRYKQTGKLAYSI